MVRGDGGPISGVFVAPGLVGLPEQSREIEMLTTEQQAIRSRGIGASEIAALLGLSPYGGPLDIWLRKTGRAAPSADSPHTDRGNYLEPALRTWASATLGVMFEPCDSLVCDAHPLVLATPDGIHHGDPLQTLELKAPGPHTRHEWGDGDDAPDRYVIQVAQQMLVTGAPVGHLCALVDGELRAYRYERDAELEGAIIDAIETFWVRHILTDEPPPFDGSKGAGEWLTRRFPRNGGLVREADAATAELIEQYRAARLAREAAESSEEALKQRIQEAIGDDDGITCPLGKVTWRLAKGRRVTDWQALARELGATDEQIAEHTRESEGSRRFLASFKKGV